MTDEAKRDMATARKTKCRVWLKAKLAYWITKAEQLDGLLTLVKDAIEDADEFETDWNKAARAAVALAENGTGLAVVDPVKSGERR